MTHHTIIAAVVATSLASTASAQYTFTRVQVPDPVDSWTNDIEFADFNGDGLLDVTAGLGGIINGAIVFIADLKPGETQPTYSRVIFKSTNNFPPQVKIWESDGPLNIPQVYYGGRGTLELLHNDGFEDPFFFSETLPLSGGRRSGIGVGDFDDDGDSDFIANKSDDDDLFIYERLEGSQDPYDLQALDEDAGDPADIEVADFDGDGDTDIISLWPGGQTIYMYERLGPDFIPGIVNMTRRVLASGPELLGVRAAQVIDIDNDGDLDLVIAATGADTIVIMRNDGQHPVSFDMEIVTTDAGTVRDALAVDFDGDGDDDILSTQRETGSVVLYVNLGDPTLGYVPVTLEDNLNDASDLAVGDLDLDGDMDFSVTSRRSRVQLYFNNSMIATNQFTGTSYPSIAEALSEASPLDTIEVAEGQFALEPVIDLNVPDVSVLTTGSITQPVYGDYTMRGFGVFFAPIGITLSGRVFVPEGETGLFATGAFEQMPTGLLELDASATLSVSSANAVLLDGEVTLAESSSLLCSPGAVLGADDPASAPPFVLSSMASLEAQSVTNGRTIELDGGAIDAATFTNDHRVIGRGEIVGDVQNNGEMAFDEDTTVTGSLANVGTVSVSNRRLFVSGNVSGTGAFLADFPPEDAGSQGMDFGGDLTLESGSSLRFPGGGLLVVDGAYDVAITDHNAFDMANARIRFNGDGAAQLVEAMSADIGADPLGLDRTIAGHYPVDQIRSGVNSTVFLIDNYDNSGSGAGEAIYVSQLTVGAGSTLRTGGIKVYYETLTLNGTVDDPANLIPIQSVACAGDCDGSGAVDFNDLVAILFEFGPSAGDACDGDASGTIDFNDLVAALFLFGACP